MRIFSLCVVLCFANQIFSQSDLAKQPTMVGMGLPAAKTTKGIESPLNSNFDFNKLPSSKPVYNNWDTPNTKNIDLVKKDEFVKPGDLVAEKLNKKENDSEITFKGNKYYGDFRNNGLFVKFVCRDFGEVDGDRVRVYLNDAVVMEEILLEGIYKVVKINLVQGFNKIEFQALNQGTSGPNTAEFKMFDDQGALISSNQWNLATGNKASLIIVKE